MTVHEVFGPKLWKRYKPYRRRLYQRFEQIIFWFPYTHTVCVSEYTKRMLHKRYKRPFSQLKIIPNGIDTSVWTLSNKQESLIDHFRANHHLENNLIGLYYGHSGASKGLDYLLKSLPKIIEKHPTFKLILNLIPGKRDYYIHQLIKQHQLEKHIILLHGVQQHVLVNLVLLADMVIVPSVSEGFGLAAAEVSTLGQPLIVSKNGSLPEVVSGKVVFLHSLKPDSFVAAVDKVVARQRHTLPAKSFSREETVNQYEQLYNNQS